MPWLKLFHGRDSPDQVMDTWGDDGPIFGPYPYFHTVYAQEILFDPDNAYCLPIVDGLVVYDGMYYGDWSVMEGPPETAERCHITRFDPSRAKNPVASHNTAAE